MPVQQNHAMLQATNEIAISQRELRDVITTNNVMLGSVLDAATQSMAQMEETATAINALAPANCWLIVTTAGGATSAAKIRKANIHAKVYVAGTPALGATIILYVNGVALSVIYVLSANGLAANTAIDSWLTGASSQNLSV